MAKALILCPTHDHCEALFLSIASVRAQTETDWRMVVICDGSPPRTREIVEALAAQDPRIEARHYPKGERYGEAYRDEVIRDATEPRIFHLSDDDIWHESHLARMDALLDVADWGYQSALGISTGGSIAWSVANLGTRTARAAFADQTFITGGLNNVAYRRDAYLSLPLGWQAAPAHLPSDCFMWAKFLSQPQVTVASSSETSFLKLASAPRSSAGMTRDQSLAELGPWLARVNRPGTITDLRARAGILAAIFRCFAQHRAGHCETPEEAFATAGFQPRPETASTGVALGGAPLPLPLTAAQRQTAAHCHLTLRAFAGPSPDPQRWQQAFADDPATARQQLVQLSHNLPDLFETGVAAFESGPGNRRHAAVHRVRHALFWKDTDVADAGIAALSRQWPTLPALPALRKELAAVRAALPPATAP
ncbi:glycosyltransferase family 2 protein [Algicella marina]|uniref:Glycosyltransferase n=1 Tax=Algicella marina TaxID=2683284 RepID=A0A6P1T5P2_9RHOB|nr:glycosyltransferase family A protein [Algicella marina]QHQ37013.1 glycosyltransferase [Algicella marina]